MRQGFLDFVLDHSVAEGVQEPDQDKLRPLLLKYRNPIADALAEMGAPGAIGRAFAGFQRPLYPPGPPH